jgi:hypothetical protein
MLAGLASASAALALTSASRQEFPESLATTSGVAPAGNAEDHLADSGQSPLEQVPPDAPMTLDEAIAIDAAHYAADTGVSREEAVRRVSAQDEIGQVVMLLRGVAPERHAALWLEHQDWFGLVIWFTGDADAAVESRISAIAVEAPVPVEARWNARFSKEELRVVLRQASPSLWEYEGTSGIGIDEGNNGLMLSLQRESPWAQRIEEFTAELEAQYGVPFVIELVDGPMQDQ